jgi:hypothetical protein
MAFRSSNLMEELFHEARGNKFRHVSALALIACFSLVGSFNDWLVNVIYP